MRRFIIQRRIALLAFFGVVPGILAALAVAQTKPPAGHEPTAPLQRIALYLGQSEVVHAPWPIKRTSVTDPKIVQIEPLTTDQILLQGKGLGTTDLMLWSAEEQVWRARVDVEMDLRLLKEQMGRLFPGSNLELIQNQNVVAVSGTLRRAEDAAALHQFFEALKVAYVDMTSVTGVQQVLLQVRMAEANQDALRSLGINALWTGLEDNPFFITSTVGSATGGAINSVNIGAPAGAIPGEHGAVVPQFNSAVGVSPLVTMNMGFPRADLQFLIQALAENQYVRLLAEPNLVAQTGEEADFLAGGEFPIPVVQGTTTGGGTSITIEYKEFGVRLRFRPMVLGDGKIRLYVAPEVSQLSQVGAVVIQGFSVPALTTRRAATTLELNSGQSFAMAGLLERTTNATVDRVPGIGDLPVIGDLFRSVNYQEGETELVVLVTASLVEPLSKTSMPPLPGAMHRRPNDWELYLGGMIEGTAPPALSEEETDWLKTMGFENLRGPGAWASYGEEAPRSQSTARPTAMRPSATSGAIEDFAESPL